MSLPRPETTKSLAYTVSAEMLRQRIGCKRTSFWKYRKLKLIPPGKKRVGVKGLFFTKAQANALMDQLGSKAERFNEFN